MNRYCVQLIVCILSFHHDTTIFCRDSYSLMKLTTSLTLAILLITPLLGNAQMFSVEKVQQRPIFSRTTIYATYSPHILSVPPNQLAVQETDFSFDGPIFGLGYEGESFLFNIATGQNLGILNSSIFNVSISLTPQLPLIVRKKFRLSVPFLIQTDFTRIRSGVIGVNDELVQNVGKAGAGAQLTLTPFPKIKLDAAILREVGFLTRRFGTTGGRQLGYQIPVRLYGFQLFDKYGLSLMYTYQFSNYDVTEPFIDYDHEINRFGLGINF